MKLYVAGPMTGLPEFNFPAFRAAAADLQAAGFTVVDPSQFFYGPDPDWAVCVAGDIAAMLKCDAIATLPDWWKSRGASLEIHIAETLGMPVQPVREWTTRAAEETA